jgi:hypothetical protein
MNEIILAPCDAGYVQSCTGLFFVSSLCFGFFVLVSGVVGCLGFSLELTGIF